MVKSSNRKIVLIGLGIAIVIVVIFLFESNKSPSPQAITDDKLICASNSDCVLVPAECCSFGNFIGAKSCVDANFATEVNNAVANSCGGMACPYVMQLANFTCSCNSSRCLTTWTPAQGNSSSYFGLYKP